MSRLAPRKSKKGVMNMISSRKSRIRFFHYIVLLSFIVIASSTILITQQMHVPGNGIQLVQSRPIVAAMPGSSDPSGDEWPMFRGGLNYSGATTTTPVEGSGLIWRFKTGGPVHSSPAIAGGKVFVGSDDGKMYCLNSSTGDLLWSYTTPDARPIQSAPAIADNRVVFGCFDNKTYCLDAVTGALLWTYKPANCVAYPFLAINKGRVYTTCGFNITYCLNVTTGLLIWSEDINRSIDASPAAWMDYVVVSSTGRMTFCLNATTGHVIWSSDLGGSDMPPAIKNDGRAYLGALNDTLICFNITSGKILWQYTSNSIICTIPTIFGDEIYVGYVPDYGFHVFDAITGIKKNRSFVAPNQVQDCVCANSRLYAGCVYYGLYCFNTSSSKKLWNYTINNSIGASLAIADGHVFVPCEDGYLYCFPMILTPQSDLTTTLIIIGGIVGGAGAAIAVVVVVRRKDASQAQPLI